MKVKLDENLPLGLATLLRNLGHEANTLREEDLLGCSDAEVWQAAQKESRFLIAQDLDFSDARKFAPGSHNGILPIRLRSPNRKNLIGRVVDLFQQQDASEWTGCFVIATERKIRIRRPETKRKF